MQKWKIADYRLITLGIVGILAFILLYPHLYSISSIHFDMPKDQVIDEAESLITSLGYDISESKLTTRLQHDANQIRLLQRTFGTRIANQCMCDSLPVFFWDLTWKMDKKDYSNQGISIGSDSNVSSDLKTIQMGIDLKGNPIFLEVSENAEEIPDTSLITSYSTADTRHLTEEFVRKILKADFSSWILDTLYTPPEGMEKIHYVWKRQHMLASQEPYLEVQVQSGHIKRFNQYYKGPQIPTVAQNKEDLYEILSFFLIYIFFIILGAIFFFSRLRSDKLDLKGGLIPALVVLVGWCITNWTQNPGKGFVEGLIEFFVVTPFVAGGLWIMFIIGESYTRETWPHRLVVVDKLRQYFYFPELGASIIRGLSVTGIGLGMISILGFLSINYLGAYCVVHEMLLHFWAAQLPSLYALGISLLRAMYIVVSFCLFFTSFLRQRIKNKILFWIILFLFWSFVSLPLPQTMPYFSRMSISGLLGLLITYCFIRYNLMTTLIGAVSMPLVFFATSALYSSHPAMIIHGAVLTAVLVMLLLIAIQCFKGNIPVGTVSTYVPDYIQRIYEKERIQRELEIARNVQVNFLPRSTPNLKGLDIGTLCSPAKEVGGDYFDFIQLTPEKLGMCIGDVSGKGISAAFYMTLTKGFLQSQARSYNAPRDVLIHINELFYENANREMFISMIYGIYDLTKNTLTLARAGHSPILVYRKQENELLEYDPPGIALGLDCSDLFSTTIKEIEISFSEGDSFLFYTDGINEAQNRFKEEFGDERLKDAVLKHVDLKSHDLLQALNREIKAFTGRVQQHDDMTALMVKVSNKSFLENA